MFLSYLCYFNRKYRKYTSALLVTIYGKRWSKNSAKFLGESPFFEQILMRQRNYYSWSLLWNVRKLSNIAGFEFFETWSWSNQVHFLCFTMHKKYQRSLKDRRYNKLIASIISRHGSVVFIQQSTIDNKKFERKIKTNAHSFFTKKHRTTHKELMNTMNAAVIW